MICSLAVGAFSVCGGVARAESPSPAPRGFALIVGVNKSVDRDAAVLRYADDDALKYQEFFSAMGMRTYLLTRPDDNTRRIHPQSAAVALPPTRASFVSALDALADDVAQAARQHVPTTVYFVYAGHGNVKDGAGYLALEDSRVDSEELDTRLVEHVHATQTHVIVDACFSYFLAVGRGPGGERHPLSGFSQLGGLARHESVGLLLSTSSARESHEWAGVEGGVFSHEVRSGLYGAADADGDGTITYREIAAFVQRANASIENERFRADVFARPPAKSSVLVDLRSKTASRIVIPGTLSEHYYLEDGAGVRIADLHNELGQAAYLFAPPHSGNLYLHRVGDDAEFLVPPDHASDVSELKPSESPIASRGAANDAYRNVFSLPFGRDVVQAYQLPPAPVDAMAPSNPPVSWRTYAGIGIAGVGVAMAVGGALTLNSAFALKQSVGPTTSQADVASINDKIRTRNALSGFELGAGGIALASGLVLLLWPNAPPAIGVQVSQSAGILRFHGQF